MTTTKDITDEIRDIINWVAVFREEYDLPEDVVEQLRGRLEKLVQLVSALE